MKSAAFIAAAGALLASAGPVDKRAMVTDWVTDVVYVTVTAGDLPVVSTFRAPAAGFALPAASSSTPTTPIPEPSSTISTSTPPPPPPPAPTTTSTTSTSTTPPPPPPPPATTTSTSTVEEGFTSAWTSAWTSVWTVAAEGGDSEPTTTPTTPSSTTPAGDSKEQASPTDLNSVSTYWHNVHRRNHTVDDLLIDDGLIASAQSTADYCDFEHHMHENGGGYGQNIAMYGSTNLEDYDDLTALSEAISNFWYNGEIGLYPQDAFGPGGPPTPDMSNFEAWGHVSQLIWKGSKKVGCAAKRCPKGTISASMETWFTVCNYSPPGNMGGAYGDNVLKSVGETPIAA